MHRPPIEAYHTGTSIPGKISAINDPGAFAGLLGSDTAIELIKECLANGYKVEEIMLEQPLDIAGVGNGTQQCRVQLKS